MKTIKSLTEAEIAELPKFPERWGWAKLEEISTKITDGEHFRPKTQSHGVYFLSAKDVKEDGVSFDEPLYISKETSQKALKRCNPERGDILIVSRGATVGRMCIVKTDTVFCLLGSVILIKVNEKINTAFLNYMLKSPNVNQKMISISGATAQQAIYLRDIKNIAVPLPPLPEQRAIVSKIELLFSELDNGISNLKLAQDQLKVYRQAVLKKAFEGELTKKWREKQTYLLDSKYLLEQIRKEREEAVKVFGKKLKKVNILTEAELVELPRLPGDWKWAKIGEVLEVFVGSTPSRKESQFWDGDIPWVSSGEVAFCRINSTKESITKLGLDNSSTQIHPIGTVMLGMIGEGKTRGQVAILNINACHNQNTAAIRIGANYLSEFVYYFFAKNYNENRRIGSGNNQQALNKNIIENMLISLCSLPEQQAIVQEIETRLSVCDKIEQDIKDNLEKAEALRQSILKKAFEGKLLNERELAEVREAEDWGPAEVLLEKIRVERAENGKK